MLEISGICIFAAFLAGAISFLSPCVLSLVPGYVSYIAGQPDLASARAAGLRARLPAAGLSLCFVLGFSTVFVLLGAGGGGRSASCSSSTARSSISSAERSSSSSAW